MKLIYHNFYEKKLLYSSKTLKDMKLRIWKIIIRRKIITSEIARFD